MPEYRFDRYRKGRKMAEGLVLTKPTTVEQAMETAYLLADPGDMFVFREDLARLAAVEAERDAARAGEARAVEALKRIVRCEILPDAQDLNHGDHCLCNFCENKDIHEQILAAMNSNALAWLAQQRREAVAAWIEKEATKCRKQNGEYYDRGVDCMLREAAALRAGEVGNE